MKQRNKWKRRASVLLMAAMMLNTTFVAQAKWFHDDDSDKWYYENNNGNRIKDDVVQIGEDGKWYAFDQGGWMRTGWIDDLGGGKSLLCIPFTIR